MLTGFSNVRLSFSGVNQPSVSTEREIAIPAERLSGSREGLRFVEWAMETAKYNIGLSPQGYLEPSSMHPGYGSCRLRRTLWNSAVKLIHEHLNKSRVRKFAWTIKVPKLKSRITRLCYNKAKYIHGMAVNISVMYFVTVYWVCLNHNFVYCVYLTKWAIGIHLNLQVEY
jgi:hypothetical protein